MLQRPGMNFSAKTKFKVTSAEDRRNLLEPLPNHRDPQDELTRQEFDQTNTKAHK